MRVLAPLLLSCLLGLPALGELIGSHATTPKAEVQRDFPALAVDAHDQAWVAYIEHDGKADTLWLGKVKAEMIEPVCALSEPGVLHHPALAARKSGELCVAWGQLDTKTNTVSLRVRNYDPAKAAASEEITLATSAAYGNSFADLRADPSGRIWIVWQALRPSASQLLLRSLPPGSERWTDPTEIASAEGGGNWAPQLACTKSGAAWIAYDSSAGGEFNLRLAQVDASGQIADHSLTESAEYEARAGVAAAPDGSLWIAGERGKRQWGEDSRGHDNNTGLNARKRLLLGRFDPETGTFTEFPVPDLGRPAPAPNPSPAQAVNLPNIACTKNALWISYRYFTGKHWKVALIRRDFATGTWSEPIAVPESSMGQDRQSRIQVSRTGELFLSWPSDGRKAKAPGTSAAHVARIDPSAAFPPHADDPNPKEIARSPKPEPYLNEPTPPRAFEEHGTWEIGGKTYTLYFGDVHRHTDLSNCRTGFDGSIVEAYRYAYDIGQLDFLGTSDHTDAAKPYHPYEWWETQRLVDVFHAPGGFASLYAYEREQRFPWGHRNVVFAERGGPLVYIKRALYRTSPWQADLPIKAGLGEITPMELWEVLDRYGRPVSVISHTGATGMGTDWTKYKSIDNRSENIVEIFQGARVSYEGVGLAQPTVGLRAKEPYTPSSRAGKEHPMPPAPITDFTAGMKNPKALNNGTYQTALAQGHRLGSFASSDHIATHTAFGGVWAESADRLAIVNGMNARLTTGGTDKIIVRLQSGEHPMGSAFKTSELPKLTFDIEGTAPLAKVTIVRNELDWEVIEPEDGTRRFAHISTDKKPFAGENRYYLRIEQEDGNMAWSSPLWIHYEAK